MRRAPSLLVVGLAALAAVPTSGAPAVGGDGPAAPGVVAVVEGRPVHKAELADLLYQRFRERWSEALDELVDERLLEAEVRRAPVEVPEATLDAAVETEANARAAQLRERFGADADLDTSVRAYYGIDAVAWRRDVLRPRLRTQLLLQRVVRLSSRRREQVVARVIVLRDAAKARSVREKIERGADFSLTALEISEDPSRAQGGAVPPLARGDLAFPDVERALFAAAPGALVGPIEVRVAGASGAAGASAEYHLYRVVERVAPWEGDSRSLAVRLERDLAERPVGRAEYERWLVGAKRRYGVEVYAPDGRPLRPHDGPR